MNAITNTPGNTAAPLADSLEACDPIGGVYYIPSDGSALAWEDLRMQLQFLSEPPSYPQALLAHAQAHWPLYADGFRAALAHFVQQPEEYADAQRTLHLYAGYLLAQFRDAGCFSLAQELLTRTDQQLGEALGDDYESVVGPWIAAFCHQDAQRLQWLADAACQPGSYSMENRHLAVQALAMCTAEGVAPLPLLLDAGMALCRSLIAGAQRGEVADTTTHGFGYDTYVSFAVCDLMDAGLPLALLPEIETWFAQGHVDDLTIGLDEFRECVQAAALGTASPPPAFGPKGLPNSIDAELGQWAMFSQTDTPEDDAPYYLPDPNVPMPFVRFEPKVGRNDPCPCRSGKKYKKCCGG